MKVLFIENRYRTFHWEKVATELQKKGHQIFWIVQNHGFTPQLGNVFTIPYFSIGKSRNKKSSPEITKVIQSDRGVRYFGVKTDEHFYYYSECINDILNKVQPDIVFGESTLFHELLIIQACKSRGILYLHPTTCRYPVGRFSFYEYDTLKPFGQCGEEPSEVVSSGLVEQIVNRTVKPDYMTKPIPLSLLDQVLDKIRLVVGYYQGEKFNTPNPFVKIKVDRKRKNMVKLWEANADEVNVFDRLKDKYKILYPLQMQPEANIDVWGSPHNNQAELVKKILQELHQDEILVIKPNPKSKYEIDAELINVVSGYKGKVIFLKHTTKMSEVFHNIDFVVTVTGTVSIEAFFADKPFAVMGDTTLRYCFPNLVNITPHIESVRKLITLSKKQNICHSLEEKTRFMSYNILHSFKGVNGDGFHNRHYMLDDKNMGEVVNGFLKILNEYNER